MIDLEIWGVASNTSPCLVQYSDQWDWRLISLSFQGMAGDSRGPPGQFGQQQQQQQQQHQLQHQQQQPLPQHQQHQQQQQQANGDSYNGPDSLRNTANKMFNRNGGERSSSQGYNNNNSNNGNLNTSQGGGYQNNYGHGQQLNQSHQSINHSLNHSMEMSHSRLQQSTPNNNVRPRQNSSEDPTKRNSYGNQSFRNAIQTPGQQQQQQQQQQQPPPKPGQSQKLPPVVPPKPGSRSASKERPRDSTNDENDHLETELKNILRGNHKDSFDKTNGSGEWSIRLMWREGTWKDDKNFYDYNSITQ